MNKQECQELIIKYLNPYLEANGFKHKKSNRADLQYLKKTTNGYDEFYGSTINYSPKHYFRYYLLKRLDVVEDIIGELNKGIKLIPPIRKDESTFGFSYMSLNNINNDHYLPIIGSEQDVVSNVNSIIEFMQLDGFPTLNKFNDIRLLDKEINGEGENFYEDDWQKPLSFGGLFNLRRLIIAKLSGRRDYDEFIERILSDIEKRSSEAGEAFDRNNFSFIVPYTINLLKNVKPLS